MVIRFLLVLAACFFSLELVAGALVGLSGVDTGDVMFFNMLLGSLVFQGTILGVTFFFLRQYRTSWAAEFGFATPGAGRAVGLALLIGTAALVIALAMHFALSQLLMWLQVEAGPQIAVKILQMKPSPGRQLCMGALAIGLAPVAEEILFRGILYPTVKQAGYPQLALWGTAILFAVIHLNLLTLVPLTFLAVVWTWLYERTDNLLAPILAHCLFNAANFFLAVNEQLVQEFIQSWLRRLQEGGA